MSLPRASAASAALGATLAAVALLARGGNDTGRMAAVEISIVLIAGLVVAAAVLLLRRDEPLHGSVALTCFAVFTAITALSMTWSIAPDDTLQEAARSFAYLAIFAAAVAGARIAPEGSAVVVRAVVVAATAVVVYALASRIWPGSFGDALGARLGEPYDYWNALGATAALGVLPALWIGTRPTGSPLGRALALPALGLLILTILLTQSRGALGAAAIAVVVWLAVVPLRLRTLVVLAVPAAAAAPVAAWALSKDAFTEALQTLEAREAVAGDFGLLVVLMIVALLAAGIAGERLAGARALPLVTRRRVGIAAIAAACVLPLGAVAAVAVSDRGLSGTLSDRVDELTDDTTAPPEGAARLGSVSSSRGGYWRQAGNVFEERPAVGTGAGSFRISRLPYRKDLTVSAHAHGFPAQTIADLGLVGLAASLALLGAWLAAAARATGFERRRERQTRVEWSTERTAVFALALCAVTFGLQSTIDWTWFVPGPSAIALVAAGFVAGRGALPALGEPSSRAAAAPLTLRREPARLAAAAGVLVGAGLCAWAVWQPEASERANDRAVERLEDGDLTAAAREADHARDVNPYSPEPLYVKAQVLLAARRPTPAYHTLEQAVKEHPRDPDTWLRLARFELEELDLPARAVESIRGAFHLDPYSPQAVLLIRRANRQLGIDAQAGRAQPRERASAVAE